MRLTVIYGEGATWSEQIVRHLRAEAPDAWQMQLQPAPEGLPVIVEEPARHIPAEMPHGDLLLVLAENTPVAQLVPELAEAADASEVIVPVDDEAVLPLGLQKQIRNSLQSADAEVVFPTPFCSLTEHHGRGPHIREFAGRFGQPRLAAVSDENEQIREFSVLRCAPCGNTAHVARQVRGLDPAKAEERGPLVHQFYPCLASHDLIYQSALITRGALRAAIRRHNSEMKEGRT